MYGLDPDIDLSFLKNREVIQVAVGLYQIVFAFDGEITVSVEGRCERRSSSFSTVWIPDPFGDAAGMLSLLGQTVVEVQRHGRDVLELIFASGDHLLVFDDCKEYESYQITRPGETIVV